MKSAVHPETTVREAVARWPATRSVFERYGIPIEIASCPAWETIEQAAAAQGHWAAEQLIGELNQVVGRKAGIQPNAPVIEVVAAYPATQVVFERFGIPCQAGRVASWETIEQAAAAQGHWAIDGLLDELNALL